MRPASHRPTGKRSEGWNWRLLGHESGSAGCLLAGTSQAIGKRLCGRIVDTSIGPEFVPKHNSELSYSRGRSADDEVCLQIGEM